MAFKIRPLWLLALLGALLMRIYFYLATPLIDNDSIVIFMGAVDLVQNGVISKVNTLPVILSGLLYYIFGEHILLARLPQILGGIGCIALLFFAGRKAGNYAGYLSAILFAALPIAILYSSIAKSYSLMVFLIFAGAMVFGHAVEASCSICSIITGLLFSMAFLCYTFAACAIFPVIILFIISCASKKWRMFLKPTLITGTSFALVLVGIGAWRWRQFGWSIFNDYVTDWRFDAASAIWSGRYIGLMDIWGVGIAVIVPGIVVFIYKFEVIRKLGAVGIYGLIFTVINILLWLFNPVNHFPRVLLPCLPFVALFIAATVQSLAEEKTHPATLLAWLGASTMAMAFLYPRFQKGHTPLWFFTPQNLKGVFLTILAIALIFLFLLIVTWPLKKWRLNKLWIFPTAISLLVLAAGPVMVYQVIIAQSKVFQSRADLTKIAGVGNLMGGGDYQLLAHASPETATWLMDLKPHELDMVISGQIIDVCKNRKISHVIVSHNDPEGALEMLAGMALEKGDRITDIGRAYRPFEDKESAYKVAENEYGVLYKIIGIEDDKWSDEHRMRLNRYHSPFELKRSKTEIVYEVEGDKLWNKLGGAVVTMSKTPSEKVEDSQ